MQPTSDKKAIKKSYARLLKQFHPEEDPEGFQSLKEAYDEARMLAAYIDYNEDEDEDSCLEKEALEGDLEEVSFLSKQVATGTKDGSGSYVDVKGARGDEESDDAVHVHVDVGVDIKAVVDVDFDAKSDVDSDAETGTDADVDAEFDVDIDADNYDELEDEEEYVDFWGNHPQIMQFMDAVNKLYEDYEKRIELDNWKELFINNTIWDLEANAALSHRMIGFLSDHRYIPLEIWRLIGLAFDWEGNEENLRLYYEDERIDELMGMIRRSSYLGFSCLTCLEEGRREEYLKLRDEAYRQVKEKNDEVALGLLVKAKEIFEDDPDLSYIKASIHQCCDRKDMACDICSTALQKYPEDLKLVLLHATLLHDNGCHMAALEQLKEIEAVVLDSGMAYELHLLKIKCHLERHDYELAMESFRMLGDKAVNDKESLELAKKIYRGARRSRLRTAILMPWSKEKRENYFSIRNVFKTDLSAADIRKLIFNIVKYTSIAVFSLLMIGAIFTGGTGVIGLIIIGRVLYKAFHKEKAA